MTDLASFNKTDLVDDHVAADVNKLIAASLRAEYTNTETVSGTRTLADIDCQFQVLTASGGNQTVKLPANAITNHPFHISNAGASNSLVIQNSGATVTYVTLAPNEWGLFVQVSGLGWFKIAPVLASGPQGFADNYVITPSISSNNLVVALKTINGADPSAADPIPFRINNAKDTLTAALSLTVNAGTSVFNLGAAEFLALKQQLFVYIGWRAASSTIFLALSRIPFGKTYADFSATSTNEKYLAYTGSAPASTDNVEVIGRIDVQNSGTASFNWSLPAGAAVVNRPIFETDELTWTPTWSANGSLTFGSVSNNINSYKIVKNEIRWHLRGVGTLGGTANTTVYYTFPFTPKYTTNNNNIGWMLFADSSATPGSFGGTFYEQSSGKIANIKYNTASWNNSGTGTIDSNVVTFI
jgi:hypothetical protein